MNYKEAATRYDVQLKALDRHSSAVTEESNKKVCRDRKEPNGVRPKQKSKEVAAEPNVIRRKNTRKRKWKKKR